jgi:hypothetical protein
MIEELHINPMLVDNTVIIDKINEIIEALNKLDRHYHEALDTHYNTSYPKYDGNSEST